MVVELDTLENMWMPYSILHVNLIILFFTISSVPPRGPVLERAEQQKGVIG